METDFERHYETLGCWRGPHGTKEAQEENLPFWEDSGVKGAQFLVQKALTESNVDACKGILSALTRLGPEAKEAVAEGLKVQPEHEELALALKRLENLPFCPKCGTHKLTWLFKAHVYITCRLCQYKDTPSAFFWGIKDLT